MNRSSILLLTLALAAGSGCKTIPAPDATAPGALAHMKEVNAPADPIRSNMLTYIQTVAHSKDTAEMEQRRTVLINSVASAIRKIRTIQPYKGDDRYRAATEDLLDKMYAILTEDYGRLVDLKKISEQSYDAMEAYMEARKQANNKLQEARDETAQVEELFAKDYNIRLVENTDELGKKLEKASAAMGHQSKVFLLYFKAYKQEERLIEALDKNDISGIEQNKDALQDFAQEGLEKLASVSPLDGDDSLIQASRQLLEFYKAEANKSELFLDLALKKDRLDRAKQSIDSMDPARRTKDQIDSFNKLVNEYNALAQRSNALNSELNNNRKVLIDRWNRTSDLFLSRHVPK
ncbi:MAG: hypothetical protein KDK37_13990 [Leptospiraceae bacterium]|nr:hypothetical protein [Leptospiraceae bacterium]